MGVLASFLVSLLAAFLPPVLKVDTLALFGFGVRRCVSKIAAEKLAAIGKAKIAPKMMPQATQVATENSPSQGRRRFKARKSGSSPKTIPEKAPPTMKGSR